MGYGAEMRKIIGWTLILSPAVALLAVTFIIGGFSGFIFALGITLAGVLLTAVIVYGIYLIGGVE